MKHAFFRIAFAAGSLSLALMTSAPVQAAGACGMKDLIGSYGYSMEGSLYVPNPVLPPSRIDFSEAGLFKVDGAGSLLDASGTASFNGMIYKVQFVQGSYTMQDDCTGTADYTAILKLPSGDEVSQSQRSLAFVISGPFKNEVRFISTAPGSVLTGNASKIGVTPSK